MRASSVLWCAALVYGGMSQAQNQRDASIALDQSRPFVEIVFAHYGPRVPVIEGEASVGVWLKLRNNCILPIKVYVLSDENRNAGLLVTHDVVAGRSNLPGLDGQPIRIKKPMGYESADVLNSREVEPGRDLLFSVPISHVTRRWSIRVEVVLLNPVVANGRQPRTFVDFDWSGLSPDARKASDVELFGGVQR